MSGFSDFSKEVDINQGIQRQFDYKNHDNVILIIGRDFSTNIWIVNHLLKVEGSLFNNHDLINSVIDSQVDLSDEFLKETGMLLDGGWIDDEVSRNRLFNFIYEHHFANIEKTFFINGIHNYYKDNIIVDVPFMHSAGLEKFERLCKLGRYQSNHIHFVICNNDTQWVNDQLKLLQTAKYIDGDGYIVSSNISTNEDTINVEYQYKQIKVISKSYDL